MYTAEFSKTRHDNCPVHYIYPNDVPEQANQFEFVLIYKNGSLVHQPGIYLNYHGLPFRQIEFWKKFIVIGIEDIFILFNMISGLQVVNKCPGYFGRIDLNNENIYISTASNIICYNDKPALRWVSDTVAIDGIIIDKIDNKIIKGSGQCDPPDGWRDFKISDITGKITED